MRSTTLAVLAAALTAAVPATAQAHHVVKRPPDAKLAKAYPHLVAKPGFTWARLHKQWARTHPAARAVHLDRSPRGIGRREAARRGWTGYQWTALDRLWTRESGWGRVYNRAGSGACHVPQALPCSKIPGGINASFRTAIRWGLGYISGRYGTPVAAWDHSQRHGWY